MPDLPPFLELDHPQYPSRRVIVRPGLMRRKGIRRTRYATHREINRVYRDAKRRSTHMRRRLWLRAFRTLRFVTTSIAILTLCIGMATPAVITFIVAAFFAIPATIGLLPCSKIGHDGKPLDDKGAFQCIRCQEIDIPQYYREV